jgi:hypothetical protein
MAPLQTKGDAAVVGVEMRKVSGIAWEFTVELLNDAALSDEIAELVEVKVEDAPVDESSGVEDTRVVGVATVVIGARGAIGVTKPGTAPKMLAVRANCGAREPTVIGIEAVKRPAEVSGATICVPKKVWKALAEDVMATWLAVRFGVMVRLAKAACIWVRRLAWTLLASDRFVAVSAPQFKSGACVASTGLHASDVT